MYLQLSLLVCLPILSLQLTSDGCDTSETCVPIRTCDPIIEELQTAKATTNKALNTSTKYDLYKIALLVSLSPQYALKDENGCWSDENGVGQVNQQQQGQAQPQQPREEFMGEFVNIFHDIAGEVYAVSDNQLLIKDFTYDGEGPDAFFLAGRDGNKPNPRSTNGDIVLAYPDNGVEYEYLDTNIPILPRFNGNKDIILTLPKGITVNDLKWLSVWCRDYKVNFGHAAF